MAVGDSRKDEILSINFEVSWGFPQMMRRLVMMNCYAISDESIRYYVTTRPANGRVSSREAFDQAQTWIGECVRDHPRCRISSESKLPTRVLELSNTANGDISLRLHETNNEIGQYAALSYVWGKGQHLKTLRDNIHDHRKQITFESLPKTIADAVHCTSQLGLKYLWVDALCIIQDSEEDQGREIRKMSNIYKGSYVTISAAMASGCDEGFLADRPRPESLTRTSFHLPVIVPKDSALLNENIKRFRGQSLRLDDNWVDFITPRGPDSLFERSPWASDDAWFDRPSVVWLAGTPFAPDQDDSLTAADIDKEPISSRGWTLQESWLARRSLIYASGQLMWKCNSFRHVDGGTLPTSMGWNEQISWTTDEDGNVVNEDGQISDGDGRAFHFRHLWRDLVQEFSRRELTAAYDKLDAVDGIAQDLRLRTSYTYLAGLWKEDLVSQLSWYQDASKLGFERIRWNTDRNCPSWSWISVDGPISHSHAENSNAKVEDAVVTRIEKVGARPHLRLVVEGSITLRAPMSTAHLINLIPHFKGLDQETSRQQFSNTIYLDGNITNPFFTTEERDGNTTVIVPDDMRFLELSWGKSDSSQNIAAESRGLVLVPVAGRPGTYRRAGFFVVALEYDVDWVSSGYNLVTMLSVESGNVMPTEFGTMWKAQLREEVVTIV